MKRSARYARDFDYLEEMRVKWIERERPCALCGHPVPSNALELHHVKSPRHQWKINTRSYEDPIHIDFRAVPTHKACHNALHSSKEAQERGPEMVRKTLEWMGRDVDAFMEMAGFIGG